MDTKELQIFNRIVSYGSITRAAEKLKMSQPAVSSALKRIEDEVGYPLFVRRGKQLFLTEQGRLFAGVAKDVNDSYRLMEEGIRRRTGASAEITVDFWVRSDKIYRLMDSYQTLHPETCFIMRSGAHDRAGGLTLADISVMLMQDVGEREYAVLDLCNSLYAVMERSNPLAGRSILEMSDLPDQDFVFLSAPGGEGYESTYYECVSLGLVPRLAVVTDSLTNKYAAIWRKCGIGLFYGNELSVAPMIGGCRVIPVNARLTGRAICAAWDKNTLSDEGRRFAEYIEQAGK